MKWIFNLGATTGSDPKLHFNGYKGEERGRSHLIAKQLLALQKAKDNRRSEVNQQHDGMFTFSPAVLQPNPNANANANAKPRGHQISAQCKAVSID